MKQPTYRLLNEGETIQEGDELYSEEIRQWNPACRTVGINLNLHGALFRRPLQTGWIKLSERKPTEEDADEKGNIITRYEPYQKRAIFEQWRGVTHHPAGVNCFWLPLPKFEEEKDEDTEAFEKWWEKVWRGEMGNSPDPINGSCKPSGKTIWDAALAYRDGKK